MRPRHGDRRAVAGLEFAIVAPVLLLLLWGVYDVARALLAWEETFHAAEAIAQAAEKMSVTKYIYYGTSTPVSALSAQQMQDAMTTIYAEIPWLNLGDGTGLFPGHYSVTLSGVSFRPTCQANATNNCTHPQIPTVIWSSNLTLSNGNGTQQQQLYLPSQSNAYSLDRACGQLQSVAQFTNDSNQLLEMINPNNVSGGVQTINVIPQVVADVQLQFQPSFPLLSRFSYTFWASATFPAPLGNDDQAIVFDQLDSSQSNNVDNCSGGGAYNG